MDAGSENMSLYTAIALGGLALLSIILAIRGARKTKSLSDYALGTQKFSPLSVGLALAASMTSAATFIINPGLIGYYGLSAFIAYAIVLPLAALFTLVLVSKAFRRMGIKQGSLSLSHWMESQYQSPFLGKFFAILSLLMLTFIVLIVVGLSQVIGSSLNIAVEQAMYLLVVVVFGYMMFGGANSMVYTNTIQAILMLIVALLLIGSGYEHFSDGIHGFREKLAHIDANLATAPYPESPLFRDFFEIIVCQVLIGVAIIFQPHIITKSLLLKSDKALNKYLITAVIVEILFFLVVITGLYARLEFPDLSINGSPLPPDQMVSVYVVREFPVWLGLIVILGLISAGLSTLEGLIQSLSTIINREIVQAYFFRKEELAENKKLLLNRIIIGLLALISLIWSYQQIKDPNLSVALLAQNGVYAFFAAAFVPIAFGLFIKNFSREAATTGAIIAVATHFATYYLRLGPYMQEDIRNPAVAASYAIIAASLSALALHSVSAKKSRA